MKRVQIRCIFLGNSDSPIVEVADDETLIGAVVKASMWWVYVAREVDIPAPRVADFGEPIAGITVEQGDAFLEALDE